MRNNLVTLYAKNTNLLDLSGSGFNDTDVSELLIFLKDNPDITRLKLNNTALTDVGGMELAQKIKISSLDLSRTKITAQTAMIIAENQAITSLYLNGINLSLKAVTALAANTKLRDLILEIGDVGEENLYKAVETMVEKNPLTRANNARALGIKTAVPSLKYLSLFALGRSNITVQEIEKTVPEGYRDALIFSKFGVIDDLEDSARKMNFD